MAIKALPLRNSILDELASFPVNVIEIFLQLLLIFCVLGTVELAVVAESDEVFASALEHLDSLAELVPAVLHFGIIELRRGTIVVGRRLGGVALRENEEKDHGRRIETA